MSVYSEVLGIGPANPAEQSAQLSGPDPDRPSALQEYIRLVLRRKWVIAGITAAALILGLIVTLLMTPQFSASSTIEIARETDQVSNFEGVERDVSIADQEFYQTQYGLLKSRTLSERVATVLRLVDEPEFFDRFNRTEDSDAFAVINGRYQARGREERVRVAGEILLEYISIDPLRLSRLVDLRFTSPDPAFSAAVANAWAENFIETNLERKIQATSYGRSALESQLAEAKVKLDESQRQLVTYASQQQIINLPSQVSGGENVQDRSIVSDDLAALNSALSRAIADRIEAEASFRQSGGGGNSAEALANSTINNLRQRRAEFSARYQQLMIRFKPDYPEALAIQSQIDELDRSIGREEGRVSASLQSAYRQAVARENALQQRVNELKQDYLDLRRRSIQYNIYQQEVDTNRALYDGLLQRFKEIGGAGGIGVNNVSIVDFADIPQIPSSPRLLINLLVSMLVGLIGGIAVALGLEQLDETFNDPAEVQRKLGLPLLGSVPKVLDETPEEALSDRKSELVDAYLAIQTNLGFATEAGLPKSFAVTSTRPSEGKSTTSLALATVLLRAGRKVILVDGDMRSPSVHAFGDATHDYGLSNFLSGDDNIEALTFDIEHLGLTAMSAGPIPPNAGELLNGDRLGVLIERLLETYDHVVVDSPPVLGLADAPLIAGFVEGVIYAVESNGIRSSQVKTALNRLASANVRIFGAVLTKFDAKKSNYGYEYGYGYGQDRLEGDAV